MTSSDRWRSRGSWAGAPRRCPADTSDVLLESAYFTRGGVLLTGRRLDLHSEASHRFERGTDPEGLEAAADRCAQLLASWAGGTAAHGYARAGADPIRRWVSVRPSRAAALLGYPVGSQDAEAVFETLGMAHRAAGDALEVEVPGYRTDIDHEVDLIEEIVRIQGYDRVGTTLPRAPHAGGLPDDAAFAARVKDALVRAGVREIRPDAVRLPGRPRSVRRQRRRTDREPSSRGRGLPAHATDPGAAPRGRAQPRARCRAGGAVRGRHHLSPCGPVHRACESSGSC